jgi:hypothetical protein
VINIFLTLVKAISQIGDSWWDCYQAKLNKLHLLDEDFAKPSVIPGQTRVGIDKVEAKPNPSQEVLCSDF